MRVSKAEFNIHLRAKVQIVDQMVAVKEDNAVRRIADPSLTQAIAVNVSAAALTEE
tara:strand:- start:155 stop:322 length:168 start_codon:yes stop_codon:yes gene_type:complete